MAGVQLLEEPVLELARDVLLPLLGIAVKHKLALGALGFVPCLHQLPEPMREGQDLSPQCEDQQAAPKVASDITTTASIPLPTSLYPAGTLSQQSPQAQRRQLESSDLDLIERSPSFQDVNALE